jgi:hypothetical protein
MRKGEKLRSEGTPMERRTRAPAPSDCSTARTDWRMRRGRSYIPAAAVVEDMVAAVVVSRVVLLFAANISLEMEQLVAMIVVVARLKRSCLKSAKIEQRPTMMEMQMVIWEKVLIGWIERVTAYIRESRIHQVR